MNRAAGPIRIPVLGRGLIFLLRAVVLPAAIASPCLGLSWVPQAGPDQLYGDLYADVERSAIFADQKVFADAIPRRDPNEIVARYSAARGLPGSFNLRLFVAENFIIPSETPTQVPPTEGLDVHLKTLWDILVRPPVSESSSSLLALPKPYVVPGGRFRELYYWDSYFTMLGLRESGREDLIGSIVDNFAAELSRYGFIPNGNRSYYLTRSQPPFFALMVELLAEKEGDGIYLRYREALKAEVAYWSDESFGTQHAVTLADGSLLNRYYDRAQTPRAEAFAEDETAARLSGRRSAAVYRDIRAAAESGWDFSSRWFEDGQHMATIDTSSIVPVDLNALLVQLERTLAKADDLAGDPSGAQLMRARAAARTAALLKYCWSPNQAFFLDYDLVKQQASPALTLAGVTPLFLHLATSQQADAVAATLERRFLRPGGVVTTLARTGQQWDAPNGWAPLEWMTIQGLRNYRKNILAAEIAQRWIRLNREVYRRSGRMMEKYNVENTALAAGGGEYPSQDGFGWTNGVLLKLMAIYGKDGSR